VRASAVVPFVLLVGGALLVGDAVARGAASLALVVVVPVVFGASAEFFLGVALVFVGVVTLPLALGYTSASSVNEDEELPHAHGGAPPAEVGGLLLVGPVPIFFGSWRKSGRRAWVAAAAVGTALLVVALVVFLWVR
jgi:uncharacterized membrane protein